MKLKYTFESVEMEDEIVLVPVGQGASEVQGVLKSNREGTEIINLLKNEISEESIIDQLSAKYDNDKNDLRSYVNKTITLLRDAGLLEE